MGADQPWIVIVSRLVDERVEVSAVTRDEAREEALKLPGVARAGEAWPKYMEQFGSEVP